VHRKTIAGLLRKCESIALLRELVDAVSRNGLNGQFPARGPSVRAFNVCMSERDELVILNSDEQSQLTKAYLMSATGVLRKAIDYQAGADAHERSLKEARGEFALEIKFWSNLGTPTKPLGEPR